jgi:hypothetical protein
MRALGGSLLIDTSPAVRLSDADLRDWASGKTFFISSAMVDTRGERAAVADAIEVVGGTPILFERFGGREDDPERAYTSEVDNSDAYVGIFRGAYGRVARSGISATHAEYRRAQGGNKHISAWVAGTVSERAERLTDLIEEIRRDHTTGSYESASDLAAQVRDRVAVLAADDVSPWVKLGNLVFRATMVRLSKDSGRIEARLRPGPVLEGLEGLVDRHGGSRDRTLTVRERSFPVRISDVATKVESSTRTSVAIDFKLDDPPVPLASGFTTMGVSYTAEEIVALRLREQLFGEVRPGGFFYYWCDFEIDASVLRRNDLPEGTVVALIRLEVTEALLGRGYVGAIRRIDVSPLRPDGRRIVVEWRDRKVYTNVEPVMRSVEGLVKR